MIFQIPCKFMVIVGSLKDRITVLLTYTFRINLHNFRITTKNFCFTEKFAHH